MKQCREWMKHVEPKGNAALLEQENFLHLFPEGADVTTPSCDVYGVAMIMSRWRHGFIAVHELARPYLVAEESDSGSETG